MKTCECTLRSCQLLCVISRVRHEKRWGGKAQLPYESVWFDMVSTTIAVSPLTELILGYLSIGMEKNYGKSNHFTISSLSNIR